MTARWLIIGDAEARIATCVPESEAHVAASAAAAFEALAHDEYEALLLCVPRLDYEALALVSRFRAEARAIPLIVLTADTDREAARDALRLGAQDCLVLSRDERWDGETLVRALDYAIERARLLSRLESALLHLRGRDDFVSICAWCRKLRDTDEWVPLEQYLARQHVQPSHGICPECSEAVQTPVPHARRPRRYVVHPSTRSR